MSCPSVNAPLKVQLERALADDANVEVPLNYYLIPLLTIFTLVVTPLIYRRVWLVLFDLLEAARLARNGPPPPLGYRQYGKPADRNLSTESGSSPKRPRPADHAADVVALFVYPIKSCYGIEVNDAEITQTGFKHDRQFVLAQLTTDIPKPGETTVDSKWNFLTQRTHPALTLVRTQIWEPDPFADESLKIQQGGLLRVSFPWTPEVEFSRAGLSNLRTILLTKFMRLDIAAEPRAYFDVPLNPSIGLIRENNIRSSPVRIHSNWPVGLDLGSFVQASVLQQLQYFLGVTNPFTIFRMDGRHCREVYRCAPSVDQIGYQANTGFADSFPISLQNMDSIRDMEARVPRRGLFTPDARRYRANVYVHGPKAYVEDDWTRVAIGGHIFHVSCRITRCKLPNTNPDTAQQDPKDNQPYNTMSKYRSIDAGGPNRPCLGMMMVPAQDSLGSCLLIGDGVKVTKTGEHWHVAEAGKEHHRPIF